jgi:UDP-glucose 6-dehydrogenase
MANLYENMIDAIAAYYKKQETDIESEMGSDERVDVDHINAQCVLDWLEADTDAMNAVAQQVKAHVQLLRREPKVNDDMVAVLSLEALHDVVAKLSCAATDLGEQGLIVCFDLDAEAAKSPKAVEITNRLNELIESLRELDGDFHDEFDCI